MVEEQKTTVNDETPDPTVITEEGADSAATPTQPQSASEDLQAQIAQLEKQAAEYKDNWLRAVADYKNVRRRADQERSEIIRNASAALLLKLLPVVDDMDRALGSVPEDIAATPWYNGVKLIAQKLQTILESEGVTPIDALGQEFDPTLHEAVIYEEGGEGETNRVTAELQRGYRLRDRVLRPTMVKVGRS